MKGGKDENEFAEIVLFLEVWMSMSTPPPPRMKENAQIHVNVDEGFLCYYLLYFL